MSDEKLDMADLEKLTCGTHLEVVLLQGAEYNHGLAPFQTSNPIGFDAPEISTTRAGNRVAGYLAGVMKDRISLVPGWDKHSVQPLRHMNSFYVSKDAICEIYQK